MTIKTPKRTRSQANIWINGVSGRMGQNILALLNESKEFTYLGGSDQANLIKPSLISQSDIIIDFSSAGGNLLLLNAAKKMRSTKFLIGTTGLTAARFTQWKAVANKNKHLVLFAPNTSFGIYLLSTQVGNFASELASKDWDIEIIETHHNKKTDSPSGTAKFLARRIASACPGFRVAGSHSGPRVSKTIGVHAVRGGGVTGEHEIRFIGKHEEISITHRAFSRSLFAEGALVFSKMLVNSRKSGCFQLEDFQIY
jgi:4-hydroxy-tetrahydrodipicolinate reductase